MPLSEYEQRVLDQMERHLASDDPRLASTLASSTPRRVGRILLGSLAILAGLLLLVGGVALKAAWLGIVGFLVLFAGSWLLISKPKRSGAQEGSTDNVRPIKSAKSAKSGKAARSKAKKASFMSRLEDRWERRRRDGNF